MTTAAALDAMPTPLPSNVAVDAHLVLPFVKATRRLFATIIRAEVDIGRPFVKLLPTGAYDISARVPFDGEVSGTMAIGFERPVATALVEAFLGTCPHPESSDYTDAIGELANQIGGQAKCELGGRCKLGLPGVAIGPGMALVTQPEAACVVIPCQTTAGKFSIEVAVKRAA